MGFLNNSKVPEASIPVAQSFNLARAVTEMPREEHN